MTHPIKKQIHPRIDFTTAQLLKQHCHARRLTEAQVVAKALHGYLNDTQETELLVRRLDKLERRVGRLTRMSEGLSDAFGIFVQVWFAHTPELEPSQKDLARRAAWQRYQSFCDAVAKNSAKGHHLIDDVKTDKEPS